MQENTANEPAPRETRFWDLARLAVAPQHSRGRSIVVVALAVALIGWIDYLTGQRLSLELFYLVPVILSVAWLGPRTGAIVAVVCLVTRVAGDLAYGPYANPLVVFWNRFTDLLVYFVLIWLVHGLLSLFRDLDLRVVERTRALQESIRVRQQLERELLDIGARERSAIGRELHDDLCQQLTGTALATKVLAEQLHTTDRGAAQDAQAIVHYVEESIRKTRQIARGLLLASIEPATFADELSELAAKASGGGITCTFKFEGAPLIPDPASCAQLFRIAQEAVRNALRHARATQIDVILGGSSEATFLMVRDNGAGLPPDSARGSGMGRRIMEHRALLIGGVLSVVPAQGSGTCVICHLPLTAAQPI